MANDLKSVYGPPCQSGSIRSVTVFGTDIPFVALGANALLRAAIEAAKVPYDVYRIESYNCRQTTSGGSWSAHAWAAAVDINPEKNPYSSTGRLVTDMPQAFVDAFRAQGFGWGGGWSHIKDPMHFSLAASEGGKAPKEAFDPALQAKADAAWAKRTGSAVAPAAAPAPAAPGKRAPKWDHGQPIKRPHPGCAGVKRWQQRMKDRGWTIEVDGDYGAKSEEVCRAFQREKGLLVDGIIGPDTWRCAWTCPVV